MKHKHCNLIIAWANGAEIEYRGNQDGAKWLTTTFPSWFEDMEYRIKPTPKSPGQLLYELDNELEWIDRTEKVKQSYEEKARKFIRLMKENGQAFN